MLPDYDNTAMQNNTQDSHFEVDGRVRRQSINVEEVNILNSSDKIQVPLIEDHIGLRSTHGMKKISPYKVIAKERFVGGDDSDEDFEIEGDM